MDHHNSSRLVKDLYFLVGHEVCLVLNDLKIIMIIDAWIFSFDLPPCNVVVPSGNVVTVQYRGYPLELTKFLARFDASSTFWLGIPRISMIQLNWSASSSPGKRGIPVTNSLNIHPKLHISIANPRTFEEEYFTNQSEQKKGTFARTIFRSKDHFGCSIKSRLNVRINTLMFKTTRTIINY